MFGSKRCSKLLLQCFRAYSSVTHGSGSPNSSLVIAGFAVNQWGVLQGRSYSTGSFWDVPHPSPRNELFLELHTAKGMLPNRSQFKAMFSPHGVHLVPHRLPDFASVLQEPLESGQDGQLEVSILADSVKRKRRMKIKKHKFKKRMKKMRHQLK